ncbi:hypothetical protein OAP83_02155 [Rickettsiales bacterium]|nr:hypothetical protein [Rickettsiales bacterium]
MTEQTLISLKKEIRKVNNLITSSFYKTQNLLVLDLQRNDSETLEFKQNDRYLQFSFRDFCDLSKDDQEKIKDDLILKSKFSGDDETLEFMTFNITERTFNEYQEALFESAEENGLIDYPEVYEFWLVSKWLLQKLKDRGEIIVEYKNKEEWWGRQTTGQAVDMDSVILDIAFDILAFGLNMVEEDLKQMFLKFNIGSDWFCNC